IGMEGLKRLTRDGWAVQQHKLTYAALSACAVGTARIHQSLGAIVPLPANVDHTRMAYEKAPVATTCRRGGKNGGKKGGRGRGRKNEGERAATCLFCRSGMRARFSLCPPSE